MPIYTDFPVRRGTDMSITLSITPPASIAGDSFHFEVTRVPDGSSGLINKWLSSGLSAASGITITQSGQGMVSIALVPRDTSGWDIGPYAFKYKRTSSGRETVATEGYLLVQ